MVTIYNQAIRSGLATGHTNEFEPAARLNWFKRHDKNTYPLYAMELNRKIIGYGSLSSYREGRQAMRNIAEVSFFLDEAHQGKGYGIALLNTIINDCHRVHINTLIAIVLDINKKSVGMLKKFGFQKWGHLKDIIQFEDKTCGHLIYGLRINQIETPLDNQN